MRSKRGENFTLLAGRHFALVLLAYYVVTTAYSLNLKRRMLIDIPVLAGLYTMRILAGAAALVLYRIAEPARATLAAP